MNMYAEVNNDSPCPWNLVMIVQLIFVYGVGNHSSRNLIMKATNMLVVGFEPTRTRVQAILSRPP